jgi:hypothetical protein
MAANQERFTGYYQLAEGLFDAAEKDTHRQLNRRAVPPESW